MGNNSIYKHIRRLLLIVVYGKISNNFLKEMIRKSIKEGQTYQKDKDQKYRLLVHYIKIRILF
jgi:hypothetical protein